MEQWYTLYTKPHCEHQVVTGMHSRGIETYLPELKSQQISKQGKKEPLFPCYLFVKIDLDKVGISHLQWTPGLRRILTFDARPTPVPESVIRLIQHKLAEMETSGKRPKHSFHPGDMVRITEGPMQDLLAVFEGPTTPGERVHVLLTFLGTVRRLRVNVSQLEKTNRRTATQQTNRRRRTRGRGRRIKEIARQTS